MRSKREPQFRRLVSRSCKDSSKNRMRFTPTSLEPGEGADGSGARNQGSSTNTGYTFLAPSHACRSAGLSCNLNPFLNHIKLLFFFSISSQLPLALTLALVLVLVLLLLLCLPDSLGKLLGHNLGKNLLMNVVCASMCAHTLSP
jgi:hypothetical protein